MLASIPSATVLGASGQPVTVEVHIGRGLPGYRIVGMPDAACRESRDRVRAAVASAEREWPSKAITVNLAPAGERKTGTGLDLAIAVGVLVASGQLPPPAVVGHGFVGELGLDGSVRPVPGVAPMVAALSTDIVVVPMASSAEAHVAARKQVRVTATLAGLVAALEGEESWPADPGPDVGPPGTPPPDLADVRGQTVARQALEIAAAGGHHALLVGPPGSGKTMLAQRIPGLLPTLDRDEALAVTMVHSAAGLGLPRGGFVRIPPFRAPHHTTSVVAMVGGGSRTLRPGEISMATHGILFLDELGEFAPAVLDGLREPLEEGVIRVSRAATRAVLPARFQLLAATNPCPCGGGPPGACECDEAARNRYLRRLSRPLLDRFDLRVAVARPSVDELLDPGGGEPSAVVARRVAAARAVASARSDCLNAALHGERLDAAAPLATAARARLRREMEDQRLTGRGYHRIRRVARTVADLSGGADGPVEEAHVEVALALRARVRTTMGLAA